MFSNPFTDDELAARLERLRIEMAARDLDLALVSTPENIFYLTGLDHWGYFAPHLLIVPIEGQMTLVTRAMERVTIDRQVRNALFAGHEDSETMAELTVRLLAQREKARPRGEAALGEVRNIIAESEQALPVEKLSRIGVETWSSGHSYGFGAALRKAVDDVDWIDITDLVDGLRLVKSPAEQLLVRRAAKLSDIGAQAAIAAIGENARECDVAAECLAAMVRAGGAMPGFGPFIRPGHRLGEEHATWGDSTYRADHPVFLEISGCASRYHAPLGRLVHVGGIPDADRRIAETAQAAFAAVIDALKPGALAREVYAAWQRVVDAAGLSHYRRHHCGYCVGIGFPPSWTGGNSVTGLRHDSDLEIREGMSFHILSWLTDTGRGDFFLSNPVLVGPHGAEVLTETPPGPVVV